MPLTNAIRLSANAALADPSIGDLYIPIFGGEVLTRYGEYLGIANMVRRRVTIPGSNSAKFPRLGGIGAERHAANTQLLGLQTESTELEITCDDRPIVSHFVIDDIDEMLMHYETRSVWSKEMGEALAEAKDQLALRLIINASRETPTTMYGGAESSFPGGGLAGDGVASTGSLQASNAVPTSDQIGAFLVLLDAIVVRWDQVRVPYNDRNVIMQVPAWHGLRTWGSPRSAADMAAGHTPLFLSTDGTYGASANQQQFPSQSPNFMEAIDYLGLKLWRTNLPVMGEDLSLDDEAKYRGDFLTTRAVAFQADAVGTVEKMAIKSETDRQVDYQNWLFVTSMLGGGGTIRPECAIEITDSD